VREVTLNGYAHQDVPFEKLVEELAVERSLSHSPLFQVMMGLQNAPAEELSLPGLSLRVDDGESQTSRFDLTLSLVERDGQLVGAIEYSTDLFERATIKRMMGHFERLLAAMADDDGRRVWELELLSEEERCAAVFAWNDTKQSYAERCIHDRFVEEVAKRPEAIAVVCAGEKLSYGELNERANRLAHHLQTLGVGSETPVGILMDRSVEMIVGLLAILKAGGTYVPLDPAYPEPRLAFMVHNAAIKLVLTQQRWSELAAAYPVQVICVDSEWPLIAQQSADNPRHQVGPDNLAYITYTSGSTGIPKGTCIPHRGVLRLISQPNYVTLDAEQVFVLAAPLAFDASTFELWGSLLNGAKLVVLQPALPTLGELGQCVRQHGVTTLWMTTGLFNLMVDEHLDDLKGLDQLLTGGDVGSVRHFRRVLREAPGCKLIHAYGPTENTTFSSCYPLESVTQLGDTVSIGRPISNTQIYLLDEHYQVVPVGGVGELYIGGDGLARGYLNQAELTAERFVPDAVSGAVGARLYRTGDRVRYLADGLLDFLGRVDHQVKLRGFRIELGEIESILNQHPAVREAVVVTRTDQQGDRRLVAYVVVTGEHAPEQSTARDIFRAYLAEQLPDYMVPSAFVLLEQLPLTPNGKVDRRALPAPVSTHSMLSDAYRAPSTPTEEMLATIWSQVLGIEEIGVDDNFFALGGHSLLATQVMSRVSQAFQIEVPLRILFERGTIGALAEAIETRSAQAVTVAGRPIVPRKRGDATPLSFAQQRLWFIDQLEPNNSFYNVPAAVRLSGELDVHALERTVTEIVRRHEVLRTTFASVNGEPVQVIAEPSPVELTIVDLQDVAAEERETTARRLAVEEAQRPFDLSRGPLWRSTLLRLSEREHALLMTMHHIVSDGWSMGVLIREMATLYEAYSRGEESPLPDLSVQYADFAAWQREWLQGEVLEHQLGYWREQLSGAPAVLELPMDHPRPAVQTFRGASQPVTLSAELTDNLKQLSQREGVTVFMTLFAAFQILLSRYSGQRDICVGTPVANRNRLETEALIGFFVNTLVLRSNLCDDLTFRELLQQVREVTLSAYTHQDVPFEKLVEELQPERSLSHSPLFQVMFGLMNAPQAEFELRGLTFSAVEGEAQTAKFDLNMSLTEFGPVVTGALEYNRDLFDPATVKRMVEHFERVLSAVITDPEQRIGGLNLIGESERRQLLSEWNDTAANYPQDKCLHQLFEEQVERTPEAPAIVFDEQQLTYRELDERANQLAHHLRRLGVSADVKVGVLMERSAEMVVSLFAILKAGGAYVPMDPEYPMERLTYMFNDSEVQVLLTQQRLVDHLPENMGQVVCVDADWEDIARESTQPPSSTVTSQNLAYVIYTSGSTGRPKGSMIPHSGICNRLRWMQDAYRLDATDSVLQKTPFSFDVSVWEFFWPLITGARLVIARPGGHQDSAYLVDLIAAQQITVIHFVPSMLQVFLEEKNLESCSCLRMVVCSGEALPFDLQERFFASMSAELHNLYGPTEASVDVTFWKCERESRRRIVPIGEPIANTQIYILDQQQRLVPAGIAGELHIGGAGLARGYLNRADLTAERFIPDSFSVTPGARLYKTGDLARYRAGGKIEYLGRLDHQIKIRGFRIELGEIEATLGRHPEVRETVVVANESASGEKRLAAYVVLSQETAVDISHLRSYLREQLPEYMVPSDFVLLDRLPLTPNGKVDRRALPAPERPLREVESYIAPRTPVEQMLAEIWTEVLRTERLGVHDNFFDAGGHSLLATQILSRVRHAFQVDISVREFFTEPTIDALAKTIVQNQARQVEQDDLAQMLAELEALSMEDTQQLLASDKPDAF
jgi:amino acid adenylation domain-containing protein